MIRNLTVLLFPTLVFAGLLVIPVSTPQSQTTQNFEYRIKRIKPNKPSVYIELQETVTTFEDCSLSRQIAYRLRLHNNTSGRINVEAIVPGDTVIRDVTSNGIKLRELPDGTHARMCYSAEVIRTEDADRDSKSLRDLPAVGSYCDCTWVREFSQEGLWIASGNSITFDVPKKYLDRRFKIYTLFNFEWEFRGKDLDWKEPRHQAYFLAEP